MVRVLCVDVWNFLLGRLALELAGRASHLAAQVVPCAPSTAPVLRVNIHEVHTGVVICIRVTVQNYEFLPLMMSTTERPLWFCLLGNRAFAMVSLLQSMPFLRQEGPLHRNSTLSSAAFVGESSPLWHFMPNLFTREPAVTEAGIE